MNKHINFISIIDSFLNFLSIPIIILLILLICIFFNPLASYGSHINAAKNNINIAIGEVGGGSVDVYSTSSRTVSSSGSRSNPVSNSNYSSVSGSSPSSSPVSSSVSNPVSNSNSNTSSSSNSGTGSSSVSNSNYSSVSGSSPSSNRSSGLIYSLPLKTKIESISYRLPSNIKFKSIKYYIYIKKGQYFSMDNIEKTIKALYKTKLFSNIMVFYKYKNRKIYLKLLLFPEVYIKTITIKGLKNSGISKKLILNRIRLKIRERYLHSYKKESIKIIKQLLKNSGYPFAHVLLNSYVLRKNKKYIININITLNKPVLISKVFIHWKTFYPAKILSSAIKHISGKPLSRSLIKNFRKRIRHIYIKKDYLNPIIEPTVIKYINKYKTILLFSIHPGYKILFHFKGIRPYNADFIKNNVFTVRNVFIFDRGTFFAFKKVLRNFFKTKGYFFNKISFREIKNKHNRTINLFYKVNKGYKVVIKNIIIKGNKPFSISEIDSLMRTHVSSLFAPEFFCERRLKRDIENIENFYNNQGYLSAKANYSLKFGKNKKSVTIYINIIKNIRTYIKSISVTGLPLKIKNMVANYFKKMNGEPLKILDADNGKNLIETDLSNNGYIFSKTRLRIVYLKNKSECRLYYSTQKSQKVIIKNIFITGNTITKTGYIKSLVLFKKGQVYNQDRIMKTQNDLYKTGLFNSVAIKLENPENIKKYKNIIIQVEDSKPISLSFGAGYGTYTRYRGFFQINDDNLFGSGKSLSMRFSKSAIYTNLLFDYYDPAIYNYRGLAFNAEALDSDIITLNYTLHKEGTSFSLIRKFNHNLKGLLSYNMSYDNLSGLNPGVDVTPRDIGFTRISSLEASLIYNSKNNVFNPTSGNLTNIRFSYSSAILDSQINFAELFVHTEQFIPFVYNTVLEYSLRFGYIRPLAPTAQVPINERFFLGGRTTVRGFPQDSIGVVNQYGYAEGGDVMENYNLQLNIPIYHNIELFGFQDGGNVFLTPSDIKPLALYKSAGAGVMYLSPIGPISFSYGFILTREPYWPSGGINFTVGTSF